MVLRVYQGGGSLSKFSELARLNERYCPRCKKWLSVDHFYRYKTGKFKTYCRACASDHERQRTHKLGIKCAIDKSPHSASYLGVYIAERVLSIVYPNVKRMPYGNPGYDFVCGKGFKIDVKSSCLVHSPNRREKWEFAINHNKTPDYFLCLGFDNRSDLDPMHIWLIPGRVVNMRTGINISNLPKSLSKYAQFEKSIDKLNSCCEELKGGAC